MKARDSATVIDCGEPVAVDEVRYNDQGEVQFYSKGKLVTPAQAWTETSYERPAKKKVLNRIPLDPRSLTSDQNRSLQRFGRLYAIDTNTWTERNERISVGSVVRAHVQGSQVAFGHLETLELRNVRGNPERVAWRLLVQAHMNDPELKGQRVGLIVDSELGLLIRINAREEPVEGTFYLPERWELIYGSSDAGKEMIPNRLLFESDKRSRKLLEQISRDLRDTQALAAVPDYEPFTHMRVWRPAG